MAYENERKTIVLPPGAGPNDARIVLDGETGQIVIYEAGGAVVALIDDTGIYAMSGVVGDPNSFVRMVVDQLGGIPGPLLEMRPLDTNENELFIPGGLFAHFNDETDEAGILYAFSPIRDGITSPVAALRLTSRGVNSTKTKLDLIGEDIVASGDLSFSDWYVGREVTVFKTASLTKTNQSALFSDPDITWPGLTTGTYTLNGDIVARTSNVANDGSFKWLFSGTTAGGYTINAPSISAAGAINALNTDEAAWGATTGHGLLTTDMRYQCHGILRVSASGDLTLQFAQNPAAAGTSITLAQNTWFTLKKVSNSTA